MDTWIQTNLIDLAKSVIHNAKYEDEFAYLFKKIGITENDLVDLLVKYNLDLDYLKNEDYSSLAMRAVLYLHNLADGTYHKKRQSVVIDFLKIIDPESVIEVGFGIPSEYIFDLTLKYGRPKLTLIDKDASVEDFAKAIFEYKNIEWKNFIDFKIMDMDNQKFVGNADVYIFMDSIEHTKNPSGYLKNIVDLSPANSKFILSMPICKIDTFKNIHYIEWATESDAEKWLDSCGLFVEKKVIVNPNPKVDFFADFIKGGFYNIIILANKK